MQIRVDNPSGTSQNNISSSGNGVLFLQKGEIVQAVVDKSIGEGLFMLGIKGMTIEASTELTLTPGQNLVLISAGTENGRLVLKIPSPEELYSARVSNHLQEIGLRADERSVLIADKLIQLGLPVTKENLENIEGTIRLLGGFSSQTLDTAGLSLLGGIKNDRQILLAFHDFMTSPTMPKIALEQAIQFLQAFSGQRDSAVMQTKYTSVPADGSFTSSSLTANAGEQLLAGRASNTAAAVQTGQPVPVESSQIPVGVPPHLGNSRMPSGELSPSVNIGMAAAGASSIFDTDGMPSSTGVSSTLNTGGMSTEAPLWSDSIKSPAGGPFSLDGGRMREVLSLLKEVADLLVIRGEERPEVMARDLLNMFKGQKEAVRVLTLIQAILASNYPNQITEIESALKSLQAAKGELIGQAAFNSADNLNTLQMGAYYFAFPLEINGRDHLVELKLYKEERDKRSLNERDEIKLTISLSTTNLGIVVFHLHWRKDQGIVIQGAVSHPDYKELIEGAFGGLQLRLQDLGYQVHFQGMKVVAHQETVRPVLPGEEAGARKLGIDIRV
ncbi:MAG: hypothetical protein GXY50_07390 [Syntrophomonadaceae bacterium]|nr:hypothetical protein [Syntrophomonadaceae bacterium]